MTDLNKIVGMLIKVLHGEYSDTRALAVVQLVLLGKKAIPPLIAFLKNEDAMQAGLSATHGLKGEAYRVADVHFRDKWHISLTDMANEREERERALNGALEAASILGLDTAALFPNIMRGLDFSE